MIITNKIHYNIPILIFSLFHPSTCFTTIKAPISKLPSKPLQKQPLFSTNNIDNNENNEQEKLNLLQQKIKTTQALEKITQLEIDLKANKADDGVVNDIIKLCNEMNIDFPPTTTTLDTLDVTPTEVIELDEKVDFDIDNACQYFDTKLPPVTQQVLTKLSQEYSSTSKPNLSTKEIIITLYNNRARVYMEDTNLRQLIQNEIKQSFQSNLNPPKDDFFSVEIDKDIEQEFDAQVELGNLILENTEEAKTRRFVESSLPKVTRKGKEFEPTLQDAEKFVSVLDESNVFVPISRPEAIPGGFILRGSLKEEMTGEDMISSRLEETFQASPLSKKYQYYYIKDPTPVALEDPNELFGSPLLLFLSNDVTPTTSPLLLSFVSFASLFLILIFSLGAFANNDMVTQRLSEMNAIGDYNDDWLNDLLLPLLGGIGVSQVLHEVGHYIVSKENEFRISRPTVLPSVYIPYLGCVTDIETSPKNLTQLFDFGIAGPTFGILSSLFFLNLGLSLTLTADASTYTFFPSLSLEFLHISNLGFSIVQSYLGDSSLLSDANGNVPLHPFAIAGFASLFVNSLNLLPLGNTDGGRISQAIFGRNGHTVIQGLIYITILGTIFFTLDNNSINSNIYLGYTIFCLLGQNDFEIPCRNEVDGVDFGRVLMAIATWVFVGLTITSSV